MWMDEVVDFSIPHQCKLSDKRDSFKSYKTKISANINVGFSFETSICRIFPLEETL